MRKKVKRAPLQSNFLETVDKAEFREDATSRRAEPEIEVKQTYMEFPKIVWGSLYCPDCDSKVVLRPDGSAICPKCIVRIPYKTAEVKK